MFDQKRKKRSWSIGEIIRYLREKQQISLECLSQGVCSIATLSRIENNERTLSILLAQCLLGRLGWQISEFESYCSDKEFKWYEKRMEILELKRQKNLIQMKEQLRNYEIEIGENKKDPLQKQFITAEKAFLMVEEGKQKEGILLIKEAISFTVDGWEESEITLLGFEELELFCMLADAYERQKEREDAYRIWEQILNYLEQRQINKKQMAEPYTYIISRIVPYMLDYKMAKRGVELCEKGLKTVSDTLNGNFCCELLYWKAKCQRVLYQHGKLEKSEIIESYQFAYYLCLCFEKLELAQEIKGYLKEEQNGDLSNQ